jgi:hypothetical protein
MDTTPKRPRAGRPKLPRAEARRNTVHLMVTDEELKLIKDAAGPVTLSTFCRTAVSSSIKSPKVPQ